MSSRLPLCPRLAPMLLLSCSRSVCLALLHDALLPRPNKSMIGFRPLPERVFNPSIPSDLKRFTQAFTLTWLISVCTPAAAEDSPSAFSNTARQRMRKQCFSPKRNPFSSARRSASVNSNTFGFPIAYKTRKDNKYCMQTNFAHLLNISSVYRRLVSAAC